MHEMVGKKNIEMCRGFATCDNARKHKRITTARDMHHCPQHPDKSIEAAAISLAHTNEGSSEHSLLQLPALVFASFPLGIKIFNRGFLCALARYTIVFSCLELSVHHIIVCCYWNVMLSSGCREKVELAQGYVQPVKSPINHSARSRYGQHPLCTLPRCIRRGFWRLSCMFIVLGVSADVCDPVRLIARPERHVFHKSDPLYWCWLQVSNDRPARDHTLFCAASSSRFSGVCSALVNGPRSIGLWVIHPNETELGQAAEDEQRKVACSHGGGRERLR